MASKGESSYHNVSIETRKGDDRIGVKYNQHNSAEGKKEVFREIKSNHAKGVSVLRVGRSMNGAAWEVTEKKRHTDSSGKQVKDEKVLSIPHGDVTPAKLFKDSGLDVSKFPKSGGDCCSSASGGKARKSKPKSRSRSRSRSRVRGGRKVRGK